MKFVNRSLSVQESSLVEQIVARVAIVRQSSFDLGVADRGKCNIQWRGSLIEIDCRRADGGRKSDDGGQGEFHFEDDE